MDPCLAASKGPRSNRLYDDILAKRSASLVKDALKGLRTQNALG